MVFARLSGIWRLTVRPWKEWPMFEWHIAHDTAYHLSMVGYASIAKGRPELTLLDLDAKAR